LTILEQQFSSYGHNHKMAVAEAAAAATVVVHLQKIWGFT